VAKVFGWRAEKWQKEQFLVATSTSNSYIKKSIEIKIFTEASHTKKFGLILPAKKIQIFLGICGKIFCFL
jgi:hypothetical protein